MAVHISDESLEGPIRRRILWQVPHAGSAVIVALQIADQAGIRLATFDPTAPDDTAMPAITLHPEEMIEVGTSLAWLGLSLKRSDEIAEAEAQAELQAEIDKSTSSPDPLPEQDHDVPQMGTPMETCCTLSSPEECSECDCDQEVES